MATLFDTGNTKQVSNGRQTQTVELKPTHGGNVGLYVNGTLKSQGDAGFMAEQYRKYNI